MLLSASPSAGRERAGCGGSPVVVVLPLLLLRRHRQTSRRPTGGRLASGSKRAGSELSALLRGHRMAESGANGGSSSSCGLVRSWPWLPPLLLLPFLLPLMLWHHIQPTESTRPPAAAHFIHQPVLVGSSLSLSLALSAGVSAEGEKCNQPGALPLTAPRTLLRSGGSVVGPLLRYARRT